MVMINFLLQKKYAVTVSSFLEKVAPELNGCIRVLYYEEMSKEDDFSAGTYVFTELVLPRDDLRTHVYRLYKGIQRKEHTRILNNPFQVLERASLLKKPQECGINDFKVYRIGENLRDLRYPVFIRCADDHCGPRSSLLHSKTELFMSILRQILTWKWRTLLIVEFLDTSDENGIFRNYGAFRVGDRVIARHLFQSRNWVENPGALHDAGPEVHDEELRYVTTNPHKDELLSIFKTAGVEYGRIDYTVRDGRIQVWEIDTNPSIGCDAALDPAAPSHEVDRRFLDNFQNALMEVDQQFAPPSQRTFSCEEWRRR
jgi:hypothetical protein